MNFPDLNLQDTSLLLRKCKSLGNQNHSFWFHSAFFFSFFFLVIINVKSKTYLLVEVKSYKVTLLHLLTAEEVHMERSPEHRK